MTTRCPACDAEALRPTLARMMSRCGRCLWEGFPDDARSRRRVIPPRARA